MSYVLQSIFPRFWVKLCLPFFISCQSGKELWTWIARMALSSHRSCPGNHFILPIYTVSSVNTSSLFHPLVYPWTVILFYTVALFFTVYPCFIVLFCAAMQGPGFITATAAIARECAGRRGRGRHSRHPRPQNPSDAPDVSVSLALGLRPLLHSDFDLLLHSHLAFSSVDHKLTKLMNIVMKPSCSLLAKARLMLRSTPVSHAGQCTRHNLTNHLSLGLPSAAIFTFRKEDHTLGNMLRHRLLKTAHVIFAAYRVSNLLYVHGVSSWKILTTIH